MSKKRQPAILDPHGDPKAELTTLTYEFPPYYRVPEHYHPEAQLLFASKGVMTIRSGNRTWIVPPLRAVWVPPNAVHAIQMSKAVSMRTLYFAPRLARGLPRACCVLRVSPLLRELVLHCCALERLTVRDKDHAPLLQVLRKQIADAKAMPLALSHPTDPRAARLAEALLRCPGDRRTLAALCRDAGASKRTMERLFQSETGMSLGRWRQRVRLLHGMRLVAEGEKITQAALDAGYDSPSAFISMFRRTLGTTPSRYF